MRRSGRDDGNGHVDQRRLCAGVEISKPHPQARSCKSSEMRPIPHKKLSPCSGVKDEDTLPRYMNTNNSPQQVQGRLWFFVGGIFSLAFGMLAIAIPCVTTLAIAKLVGYILVASGVVMLATGLFGKTRKHRLLDLASGALRILLGVIFIGNLFKAVMVLTIFLAAMFAAEGFMGILLAFKLRGKNPAWGWVLFNSLAALVLGVLLLVRYPSDAPWAVGLLFGINCIFTGMSLVMYGLGLKRAREA